MGDLITTAEANMYLPSSGDDARVAALITQISAAIEKYTGRSLSLAASFTEFLDGDAVNLIVAKRPITAITKITDMSDGSTVGSTTYSYDADRGFVFLVDSATGASLDEEPWGSGRRRWKVEYKAGYAAVPPDVKQAALILVAARYNRPDSLLAERQGDYSYQAGPIGKSGFPIEVEALLATYKEVVF